MASIVIISSFLCTAKASFNLGYTHIGCYNDIASAPTLDDKHVGSDHTPNQCSIACVHYTYFALQNGAECVCENTLTEATESTAVCGNQSVIDLYLNCNNTTSKCEAEPTLLTHLFGQTQDLTFEAYDQGRVYYIDWGFDDKHLMVIKKWYSDNQTIFDDIYGVVDDISVSCTTINLTDDDFITGYSIWFNPTPHRLDFFTRNEQHYSCQSMINSQWLSSEPDHKDAFDDSKDDFRYLSGFYGSSGSNIAQIGFQFTKYTNTLMKNTTQSPIITPLQALHSSTKIIESTENKNEKGINVMIVVMIVIACCACICIIIMIASWIYCKKRSKPNKKMRVYEVEYEPKIVDMEVDPLQVIDTGGAPPTKNDDIHNMVMDSDADELELTAEGDDGDGVKIQLVKAQSRAEGIIARMKSKPRNAFAAINTNGADDALAYDSEKEDDNNDIVAARLSAFN